MQTLENFYKLKILESYFDFGVAYEKHIVEVKRFHIMKEYGSLVKRRVC